jgi:hypothetical protein
MKAIHVGKAKSDRIGSSNAQESPQADAGPDPGRLPRAPEKEGILYEGVPRVTTGNGQANGLPGATPDEPEPYPNCADMPGALTPSDETGTTRG